MFINAPEGGISERLRTDGYNRASLVFCTVGILASGVVSNLYGYISGIGFNGYRQPERLPSRMIAYACGFGCGRVFSGRRVLFCALFRKRDGAEYPQAYRRIFAPLKTIRTMRSFASDNNSGVHPEVMAAIIEANRDHAAGYGDDRWTERAAECVRQVFGEEARPFSCSTERGPTVWRCRR